MSAESLKVQSEIASVKKQNAVKKCPVNVENELGAVKSITEDAQKSF